MQREPGHRALVAIQIVRPCESTAEMQPQLHPALLRLSAMISQFTNPAPLVVVLNRLRREFVQFESATGRTRCGELCAHLLDERCLLVEARSELDTGKGVSPHY